METNFQTSFIPKKPIIPEPVVKSRPIGFLTIISLFIFFTVLVATGVLYLYRNNINTGITKMQNDLNLAEGQFEPSKITQLKTLDNRLQAANIVLSKHIVISPIFLDLENVTIKDVRYNKFNYSQDNTGAVVIKLSGTATNYSDIAIQSDFFNKDKNLVDPVFSNLSLDTNGNVLFDLQFSVDPNFVNYQKSIETTAQTQN